MKILKILGGVFLVLALTFFVLRSRPSTIYVERTLDAPMTKVWALWNDPEAMKIWWGPKDYTAPVVQLDFRVTGKLLMAMKSPSGDMFWNTGTYKQIIPHQKIVQSLSFSNEKGEVIPGSDSPVPGKWPDEVLVTVTFKETDGKTLITVTEEGIPLIMKYFAQKGLEQQFDKFEALVRL